MQAPIVRAYGRVSSSSSSAKVTPDTTFMLASVSKVFTASAVSLMIEDGLIGGLNSDICDVIPSTWAKRACRNPRFPNVPVTWRMLVTHRSSLAEDIPDVIDVNGDEVSPAYGPDGAYEGSAAGSPTCPMTDVKGFYRDYLINKATETRVGSGVVMPGGKRLNWFQVGRNAGGAWSNYRPGALNRYSNFAFGYIAALVELVTGISFEQYTQEKIFEPLGMTRTTWFRELLPSGTLESLPIVYDGGRFMDEDHYCFIDYTSGQLRSTANDMSKFLHAMLTYGSPSIWRDMSLARSNLQCQEQNAKGVTLSASACEVGVGWQIYNNGMKGDESWMKPLNRYDWTNAGEHSGYELGCQTEIIVLPNAGVYLAVLTNTDGNGDNAAQDLGQAFVDAVQQAK